MQGSNLDAVARQLTDTHLNDQEDVDASAPRRGFTAVKKRWTVNGAITSETRGSYYFADTEETNARLVEALRMPNTYMMLHGPRGSGKTTRAIQLCEQLERDHGCRCVMVSFQQGVSFDTKDAFWSSLGMLIHRILPPRAEGEEIRDPASFTKFFFARKGSNPPASDAQPGSADDKVVLVVDEFDLLYEGDASGVMGAFLHVLRGLRQFAISDKRLHAFVGIGPFSILKLRNLSSSPFNVSDAWAVPHFRIEDTRQVFQQYSADTSVQLDDGIADAVHSLANGHAGLVSFCGKRIAEVLARCRGRVTYDSWLEYSATKLVAQLQSGWSTMGALVERILSNDEGVPEAREFLIARFLLRDVSPDDDETTLLPLDAEEDSDTLRHCEFLAREGILRPLPTSPTGFQLSSYLVRNLVVWALRSKATAVPSAFGNLPKILPGRLDLDVPNLVEGCLVAFDASRVQHALCVSFKESRRTACPFTTLPSEACYHDELSRTLWLWLINTYNVTSEVNAALPKTHARQRCDLLVTNKGPPEVWRCAIEVCAHARPEEVHAHFASAKRYGRALRAHECWVVNFEADYEGLELVWPTRQEAWPTGVIHVVHDLGWTKVCIHARRAGSASGSEKEVKLL